MKRRNRPPLLDKRIEAARERVRPEMPVAYVFSADQALVGAFRVRAVTAGDLGISREVSEFLTELKERRC